MKFLVIQTAFLGDAILGTAVLEELNHRFPDSEIDYLIRKGNESLLAGHPFLSQIIVWDKKQDKYKHLFQILKQIRAKEYDCVINLQRFAATGFLTGFSKAKIRAGFGKNPFSFLFTHQVKHELGIHEVLRNSSILKRIFGPLIDYQPKPKLYPSQAQLDKVVPMQDHEYITIAPASVWYTKQLPTLKWAELVDNINRPMRVFIIGSKEDRLLGEDLLDRIKNPIIEPYNICGSMSLLETAALMKGAVLNYCNDSGPMHLASSVNAPTRAVFCSTIPEFGFGPLSDNSAILQTKKELNCRPCGLHGRKSCPKGHFDCAFSIKMDAEF